ARSGSLVASVGVSTTCSTAPAMASRFSSRAANCSDEATPLGEDVAGKGGCSADAKFAIVGGSTVSTMYTSGVLLRSASFGPFGMLWFAIWLTWTIGRKGYP